MQITSFAAQSCEPAVGCELGEGFEASSMISISHQFESHPGRGVHLTNQGWLIIISRLVRVHLYGDVAQLVRARDS
jgi:hypothetical protein